MLRADKCAMEISALGSNVCFLFIVASSNVASDVLNVILAFKCYSDLLSSSSPIYMTNGSKHDWMDNPLNTKFEYWKDNIFLSAVC